MIWVMLFAVAIGAMLFGAGYVAGRFGIIETPNEPTE